MLRQQSLAPMIVKYVPHRGAAGGDGTGASAWNVAESEKKLAPESALVLASVTN